MKFQKNFKKFKSFKFRKWLEFKEQWSKTVFNLVNTGKELSISSLAELEARGNEVSLKKKQEIFDSVFLAESVKSMKTNLTKILLANRRYQIDFEFLDEYVKRAKFYDLYIFALEISQNSNSPYGWIIENSKEEDEEKQKINFLRKIKKMNNEKEDVLLKSIWDMKKALDLQSNPWRNKIVFKVEEKFMAGIIFGVLEIYCSDKKYKGDLLSHEKHIAVV
jgi:hypothetical protein